MLKTYPKEPFIAYGKSKPLRLIFYPLNVPGPWELKESERD